MDNIKYFIKFYPLPLIRYILLLLSAQYALDFQLRYIFFFKTWILLLTFPKPVYFLVKFKTYFLNTFRFTSFFLASSFFSITYVLFKNILKPTFDNDDCLTYYLKIHSTTHSQRKQHERRPCLRVPPLSLHCSSRWYSKAHDPLAAQRQRSEALWKSPYHQRRRPVQTGN